MKFYSIGQIAKVTSFDMGLVLLWLLLAGFNIGVGLTVLSGLGVLNVILGIILLVLAYGKVGTICETEIEKGK